MLFDLLIILLSVWSYGDQLLLMHQQRKIGSFSIFIVFVGIVANSMRIFYYLFQKFATTFLVLAFLMTIVQAMIVHVYVSIKKEQQGEHQSGGYWQNFWEWNNLTNYVLFVAGFYTFLALYTAVGLHWQIKMMGSVIGYGATIIQMFASMPQITSNFERKSIEGVSIIMILTWFFSDALGVIYCVLNDQPMPFVASSVFSVCTDLILVIQFFIYGNEEIRETLEQLQEPHGFKKISLEDRIQPSPVKA